MFPGSARYGRGLLSIPLLCCAALLLGGSPAAASWIPATDLSAPGKGANNPVVAMGDSGETVVVWERKVITTNNVQAATRSPGRSFSSPIELSTQSQDPVVAMTPGGETIALWWHFANPPGSYVLQASTRPAGGSFSSPVNVATLPVGVIPGPVELAVNSSGAAVVAWTRRDPDSEIDENVTFVQASVRSAGGGFSTPVTVSPLPLVAEQSAGSPGVAIDEAGDATVVWQYDDGTDLAIQAAERPAGGSFSTPEPLSEGGEDAFAPVVAAGPAGDVVAAWTRMDGEDFIVQATERSAGGDFSTPDDLSQAGADASAPEIAISPSGAATIAWTLAGAGDTHTLQAVKRVPGGDFSTPDDVSVGGEKPLFPSLAMSAAGNAILSWSGGGGSATVARASIRPPGGSFSAPADISPTASGFFHPDAAIAATGDATVTWARSNGSDNIVQAAGYDASPPQLRGVSIPASGTVGVPASFSADPFDVWPISSPSFSFGDGSTVEGRSVSHAYLAPGVFPVTVTARDASGTLASASGTIAIAPSYEFQIGKQKRNKKRGTVTLLISVPGPGLVAVSGKGVKRSSKRAASAGQVSLPVVAKGKALKQLKAKGKARARITVSFVPDGGNRSATRGLTVVLVKKP